MKTDILKIFKSSGALLEGHFILSSGRHSPTYFQCAKVLQFPQYLTYFGKKIADHFSKVTVDVVITPAVGGIVIGTEVGRLLNARTVFAERENGKMVLRRGFEILPEESVLAVEDVITTGGSLKEVMMLVETIGAHLLGAGLVVDRSGGNVKLHENQYSVTTQQVISYSEKEMPDWLEAIPSVKPGSRGKE